MDPIHWAAIGLMACVFGGLGLWILIDIICYWWDKRDR